MLGRIMHYLTNSRYKYFVLSLIYDPIIYPVSAQANTHKLVGFYIAVVYKVKLLHTHMDSTLGPVLIAFQHFACIAYFIIAFV